MNWTHELDEYSFQMIGVIQQTISHHYKSWSMIQLIQNQGNCVFLHSQIVTTEIFNTLFSSNNIFAQGFQSQKFCLMIIFLYKI